MISDRDTSYMREMWGTTRLVTDYVRPKKHKLNKQNQLHQKIRNDNDYDDWEYGMEPC